jgi:hypothetical protein
MLLPKLDQLLEYGGVLLEAAAEEGLLHQEARVGHAAFARDGEKMRVLHRHLQPVGFVSF